MLLLLLGMYAHTIVKTETCLELGILSEVSWRSVCKILYTDSIWLYKILYPHECVARDDLCWIRDY